eukprot:CAMPEP_0185851286 /NCGR_PEP_ID=MMETSP1354-20130828/8513_1 /TAXON_ID=708628 /ORGANISM="Erythrolobus madagascarensis, Strain CCMP3276" /LENGTH=42 /DNA_ID= /DNA_START= /DNA_END= /DNA_ORIENTATION=
MERAVWAGIARELLAHLEREDVEGCGSNARWNEGQLVFIVTT